MPDPNELLAELNAELRARFGPRMAEFLLPPPIFAWMGGELTGLDLANGLLSARFPVREEYLNPYHAMQGGMIAAAVDNTLGPLSVAIAPPNVTRTLEMKYSRPVTLAMGFIHVTARLVERDGARLTLQARVSDPAGQKLASCTAVHWIVEPEQTGQPV